jgi:hypothetical protein
VTGFHHSKTRFAKKKQHWCIPGSSCGRIDRMTAQHAAAGQLQLKYWAEARLQRWGHIAVPLSSTRVAIHGGYGRDGKKLRRLDDVVIVSSDGTVAPTVSSTPRPKARERHGAAAVEGGFVIHGGRAGGAFGDAWRWDDDVWTELRCEGSPPAPRWSHAFVALPGGAFLACGGRGDAGDLGDDVHVLDLATRTWSRVAPPAFPVAFACSTSDGQTIAFGGGRAARFTTDAAWSELALDGAAAAASRRLAACVCATARPGELVVAGGVPADQGEVGGVAVLRIGDAISCIAEAPLDLARAYPVHAAAASSGDGVVIFGGGVPCLSFAPVFGDSVRVVMT